MIDLGKLFGGDISGAFGGAGSGDLLNLGGAAAGLFGGFIGGERPGFRDAAQLASQCGDAAPDEFQRLEVVRHRLRDRRGGAGQSENLWKELNRRADAPEDRAGRVGAGRLARRLGRFDIVFGLRPGLLRFLLAGIKAVERLKARRRLGVGHDIGRRADGPDIGGAEIGLLLAFEAARQIVGVLLVARYGEPRRRGVLPLHLRVFEKGLALRPAGIFGTAGGGKTTQLARLEKLAAALQTAAAENAGAEYPDAFAPYAALFEAADAATQAGIAVPDLMNFAPGAAWRPFRITPETIAWLGIAALAQLLRAIVAHRIAAPDHRREQLDAVSELFGALTAQIKTGARGAHVDAAVRGGFAAAAAAIGDELPAIAAEALALMPAHETRQ